MRITHIIPWAAIGAACLVTGSALGDDIEGAKDHPLFGRYQGASIVFYKSSEYDEFAGLQAPHNYTDLLERNALDDRSGAEWWKAQGRLTKIRYELPVGRSPLEVMRNYEAALTAKGFEVVFKCANRACFTGTLQDPYLLGEQIDTDNGISTLYFDHARYMFVKLDRPEGTVYGSVLTGQSKDQATAFLAILETAPMEADKISFVDAAAMQRTIAMQGRIDLYDIRFDHDKDVPRPESKPTLDEIAKLLAARPDLRLDIVGHTDNRGTHDYNIDLSRRRAVSVVAALVRDYAIAPDRLTPSGAGFTSPVTSNDTEDGRARNRRVELIAK